MILFKLCNEWTRIWLHVLCWITFKNTQRNSFKSNLCWCRASFSAKALSTKKEMKWECEQYMHQEADEQISEWQSDAEVSRISITKRAPLLSYSVGIPQKFSFVWTPEMGGKPTTIADDYSQIVSPSSEKKSDIFQRVPISNNWPAPLTPKHHNSQHSTHVRP